MKNKYSSLLYKLKWHVTKFKICGCESDYILFDIYGNRVAQLNECNNMRCIHYTTYNYIPPYLYHYYEKHDLGGCFYNYNPDYIKYYDYNDSGYVVMPNKKVAKLIEKLPLDYYNPTVPVPEDLIRICYNRCFF